MKTSLLNELYGCSHRAALSLVFLLLIVVARGYAQDIPANAIPHLETLPVGTIIIPMDDAKQTFGSPARFNLKAYGLVQRLLQNNIPMKWAIKAGKAKDADDFTATASRLFPTAAGAATLNFSGGPFIVPQGYETIALQVITAFRNECPANLPQPPNACTDVNAQNVAVYQTTTVTPGVDIRYTVVHKPKIAIGQNTGVTSGVHQKLYDFSLINDYANISGSTINNTSCFTIATQPHFDSPAFISNFRQFLSSGGNVLLQCLSITTFENDAANGHFQTTNGWTGYSNGTSGLTSTPNNNHPDMPFAQYIGSIPGDQVAAVADYDLVGVSGGANQNNFFDVAKNPSVTGHTNSYVASQAVIPTANPAGGAVFELGGHDYFQTGTNQPVANYNAQRMILNALFVPVTRPAACGLTVPVIFSYKSVQLLPAGDLNHNGLITPGDTVTWTITYVNTTPIAFPNFQITDLLSGKVTFSPSLTVTPTGTGTAASLNAGYNGSSDINMLAAGATLGVGGKIVVTVKTTVLAGQTGQILNQTNASGTNVSVVGVLSDALDSQTVGVQGGVVPPPGSILQPQQTSGINPTIANILIPTAAAASITGRVISPEGYGVRGAQITVVNAATSATNVVISNPFGYFTIDGLEVGNLYVVSISHRFYQFPVGSHSFVLNDNVSGLVFAAEYPDGKAPEDTPPVKLKTKPSKGGAPALRP